MCHSVCVGVCVCLCVFVCVCVYVLCVCVCMQQCCAIRKNMLLDLSFAIPSGGVSEPDLSLSMASIKLITSISETSLLKQFDMAF